ncbi:MAG TPA: prolyl oligopeptidase family serine peptidase [Bacteriovoracaceae bacterium]|nr:prolyl oligopeptidase family serine peptidase [Bacteriovoracaceae bacterium]
MKFLMITALLASNFAYAQFIYPVAKKITQTETRFGTVIEDPYKWMENASDPDLWNWVDEQKSLTNSYLDANFLDSFAARILEIRKHREEQDTIQTTIMNNSLPSNEQDIRNMGRERNFIRWEHSNQNKSIKAEVVSSLYDYTLTTVHNGDLRRVVVTQKIDNKIKSILLVKFFSFVGWADDTSFYYVSDLDERNGGGKTGLFKHTVGQIQSEDQLLLKPKLSHSDLVIHKIGEKYYAEVEDTIGSLHLSTGKVTNPLPIHGDILEVKDYPEVEATIRSFKNANNGELHKLRLRDGLRTDFLKGQPFVIASSHKLGNEGTFVIGLSDGSNVASVLLTDGTLKMIPELKDGTVSFSQYKDGILKVTLDTYATPLRAYSYNIATSELKLLSTQSFSTEVEAEKIPYEASNGELASMWVVKKKGLTLTAKTPTILYGYGGFRVSTTPGFGMYESLPWLERGGAFVVVTLPGSLDYGNSWYELAKVGGRIHSFDSFALAAKELFKRGWTSTEHIGIMGASNGGTLVGGTLQRHSELFKAAVPNVGVMDLLNFNLFTAGKYWTEDYGNPFSEKDFNAILPLSPYHNLKKRKYPATMVMTAEFDDRVVPMHSFKYLARLQEYNTSEAPTLLYIKEWGGHARASGSPRESSRFVGAFYTFFAQQLGI